MAANPPPTHLPPQPGELVLHGLTSLENRRAAPGRPNSYIYDAVFPLSDESRDGVGSLMHYVGPDKNQKMDDVYDIRAKESLHLLTSFWLK